jgi:hypothetical protein
MCQPKLARLLSRTPGVGEIHPMDSREDAPYDFYVGLPSAAGMLGITEQNIPRDVPYIFPDASDVERWKSRVPSDGRLKVGLAWAGCAGNPDAWRRSTTLETLAPLGRVGGVWLCSLQKHDSSGQTSKLHNGIELTDWTQELNDFADTSALIANLDLVITVDCAIAHLAGAMGKPVWLLLSAFADWRWLRGREDNPWYPTMRLFRQEKLFDFQTPMRHMTTLLKARSESPERVS